MASLPTLTLAPRRSRGQPKRPPIKALRAALAFSALKHESGLSWPLLERSYIQEVNPSRLEKSARKPDAFLRYAKGKQVPKGATVIGSPVWWAMQRSQAFVRTYESPLFELLLLGDGEEGLATFSCGIYKRERVSQDVMRIAKCYSMLPSFCSWKVVLWDNAKAIEPLRYVADLDALVLILIALRASSGEPDEFQCLCICAEWLQGWVNAFEPNAHLKELMVANLALYIPSLAKRLQDPEGGWQTMRVDLADPCFADDPLEKWARAFDLSKFFSKTTLQKPPSSSRRRTKRSRDS